MTTFLDGYKNKNIVMWVDLSTHCNAACPQCHRTNPDGLGKVDWLPLEQWSLDQFKQMFPRRTMSHVREFDMCGTWGDPIMNKDIFDICKYIIDKSKSSITINTNGSIRTEEWWWELGRLCGDRLHVVFAIDGSTQEIHSQYRQQTSLSKIIDNMNTLVYAGSTCEVFSIIFKHNQHDLLNIARLAKNNGAKSINFIESNRFKATTFRYAINNELKILEPNTLSKDILKYLCNKKIQFSNLDTLDEIAGLLNEQL